MKKLGNDIVNMSKDIRTENKTVQEVRMLLEETK